MFIKYQRMTQNVKTMPYPPPEMSKTDFNIMREEIKKEKVMLSLSEKQLLSLDLNKLSPWELVIYAERMKALGHEDLWLDALKVVCIRETKSVMISYADVCFDVVGKLRQLGDFDEAVHYQRIAIQRDLKYDNGMNATSNKCDLVEIYIEQGEYEAGLEIFGELIQDDPWDIFTYSNLSITWLDVGFPELAINAANKAMEISLMTKDKEGLAEQLQDILNDAKVLKPRKSHKLMSRETYQKWQELISSPLPPGPVE